jgi:hypothetical protein
VVIHFRNSPSLTSELRSLATTDGSHQDAEETVAVRLPQVVSA